VLQNVLELGVGAGKWHHRAVALEIGYSTGALTGRLSQGVGLLEIGVGGIENDRFALPELVVQHLGKASVAPFGHPGGIHSSHPLPLVVVHVEMLGLDDLEIERAVLDLVPAEVLGLRQSRDQQTEEQGRGDASEHRRPRSR